MNPVLLYPAVSSGLSCNPCDKPSGKPTRSPEAIGSKVDQKSDLS